jgi:hypothetical protein
MKTWDILDTSVTPHVRLARVDADTDTEAILIFNEKLQVKAAASGRKVIVCVQGGLVNQVELEGLPDDTEVEVLDYDRENYLEEELTIVDGDQVKLTKITPVVNK